MSPTPQDLAEVEDKKPEVPPVSFHTSGIGLEAVRLAASYIQNHKNERKNGVKHTAEQNKTCGLMEEVLKDLQREEIRDNVLEQARGLWLAKAGVSYARQQVPAIVLKPETVVYVGINQAGFVQYVGHDKPPQGTHMVGTFKLAGDKPEKQEVVQPTTPQEPAA